MKNFQRSTRNFQRSSKGKSEKYLNVERSSTSKSVNPRRGRGFTLLEVLVSITIIAFLCGLIVGFARLANHTAQRQQARAELANWHEALDRWHARFGEYPQLDDVGAETAVPVFELYQYYEILDFDEEKIERIFYEQTGSTTNAADASLLKLSLKDPWGTDYYFRHISQDEYELWSCGPDSQLGTADDIRLKP